MVINYSITRECNNIPSTKRTTNIISTRAKYYAVHYVRQVHLIRELNIMLIKCRSNADQCNSVLIRFNVSKLDLRRTK